MIRLLLLLLLSPLPVAAQDMKAERKKAADRPRRIILNNDGGEPVMEMKEPTEKAFLAGRTTALLGTQVDSIFYCSRSSGFGVFTHFTKVGEVYTAKDGRYENNQMEALLKANLDPLKMMVDFCHRNKLECFWSMRMNDTHDGSKAEYGPIMFKHNKLKNAHPEYLIATKEKPPKHGAWSAVDYARPEVRDLAFRYIKEVCKNYDIDGFELDFFRHPVFFKSVSRGEPATKEEVDAMTALMKRIRSMADEVGKSCGRPILISVKCPDSLPYCKAIGLDLETWLKEDCLDLYVPGGYFQLNEWDHSVQIARKAGVKCYPSLDESRVADPAAKAQRTTKECYRARASDVWASGADGVYVFNFNDVQVPVLREIGDPKALAKLDRDYFASVRGANRAAGGNLPYDRYQNIEKLNPANPKVLTPGQAIKSRLMVGAEVEKEAKLKLRLRFDLAPSTKLLQVKLNGTTLEAKPVEGEWMEAAVPHSALEKGLNEVELLVDIISARNAKWTDLVLEVRP